MSAAKDLCCPNCGSDLTIEQLFGHVQDQRAFAHLAAISVPLGARVLHYIQLFAPAKNRLTLARKAKLITDLLPDLQRQAISHNGRVWEAPLAAWAIAIDGMLQQRDHGKLRLPLTNHAYLYAVLAGMADKVERADEAAVEESRRTRGSGAAYVLDEMEPQLQQTQQAIAARQPAPPRVFKSVAEVMAANPHLRKDLAK